MGVAGGIVAHMFSVDTVPLKTIHYFVCCADINVVVEASFNKGFLRDIKQQCFLIFLACK
jgi:hypothetical protein